MKIQIGGIQRFSTEDGPGIRTTVFFKGCPLHCKWCHNPELISFQQQLMQSASRCIRCGYCMRVCPKKALSSGPDGEIVIDRARCDDCLQCAGVCYAEALHGAAKWRSEEEILAEIRKDREYYKRTGGGVTLSGGEVTSHPEFARRLLDACEEEGFPVALDTCGFVAFETLWKLASHPACRTILYDLKQMDSVLHQKYTGVGNERILDNLRRLAQQQETHEKILIRLPMVHPVNDTEEHIRAVGAFLKKCGLRRATLIPYHELGLAKSRGIGETPESFATPDSARLHQLAAILQSDQVQAEILGEKS